MIEAGNSTSTQEKSETEVNVQETADKDKSENEGTVTKDEESNTPMKHYGRPTLTDIDYSDPASWTSHDDQLRQQLVQPGPMQILDIRFPRDKSQRKFSSFHYQRHLPNGEVMHRKWLQYSVSTDSVMCFCWKLFVMKRIYSLSSIGLRDWKNLSSFLSSHEKLPDHLDNVGKWKELELRLKKQKRIDDETRCARERVENYWQQILERIIALNELIDILANTIKEEILRNARAEKYFSIILDSTPDVSHVEQMTVIIRFVQIDEDNVVIAVREHFLGYVPLQESPGAFMAETILEEFKKRICALTTCEVKVMIMAAI
ncbi:zinc finger MYM-type protein 5-like [Palaemon carinicauda]|uniref:zinc finger MYM-type protein 5-like n=1 Tax=Palaemon carinicauda TaxID=392227 RepID=UPI0035B644D2